MDKIYAYIKAHKNEILAAYDAGDTTAQTIVRTHDMMVRWPDHIAEALLEEATKDWQKQHPE